MDLWIRSQDRRALYKTSGFFIREEQYKRKGKYIIESNECWLGAYNTFERALEVLDEIQSHLVVINDKNDNLFYVYEMPRE